MICQDLYAVIVGEVVVQAVGRDRIRLEWVERTRRRVRYVRPTPW